MFDRVLNTPLDLYKFLLAEAATGRVVQKRCFERFHEI